MIVTSTVSEVGQDRLIVHILAQLICALGKIMVGLGDPGEYLKIAALLDDAVLQQDIRHLIQRRVGRYLDRNLGIVGAVDGEQVVHARHQIGSDHGAHQRHGDDPHQAEHAAVVAVAFFLFALLLTNALFLILHGFALDLLFDVLTAVGIDLLRLLVLGAGVLNDVQVKILRLLAALFVKAERTLVVSFHTYTSNQFRLINLSVTKISVCLSNAPRGSCFSVNFV